MTKWRANWQRNGKKITFGIRFAISLVVNTTTI